jgi:hypothetical protein
MPFDKVGADVMLRGAHGCRLIVMVNACWAVCAPPVQLSVACTVKFDVPAAVGIPDMKPAEFIFIPDGNEPAITVKVTVACPPEVVI